MTRTPSAQHRPLLGGAAAVAALIACHHSERQADAVQPADDRFEEVPALSYRGPPLPAVTPPIDSSTAVLVGSVYSCDGRPLPAVQVRAQRAGHDSPVADTVVQLVDSTFVLPSLGPGDWQLTFRLVGYQPRSIPVTLQAGSIDTLMVQLSGGRLQGIGDCVCADGRGFGSRCCKPVTVRVCTPRDPQVDRQ
ncbi:MAG TPA: carboxypeptidase-like regulatory domain-containing protein [Gemmatimonadales bacterium]|nr:carboxypeptidase-like regulatory domain-containing protein [Gemmatimonadales bacterium]